MTAGSCPSRRWSTPVVSSGRTLRFARQVFGVAVQRDVTPRNPFDTLRFNFREGNLPCREYDSTADVQRLLAVCPPAWRTLIDLARFGGLRCPSEALLLRWSDGNLAERRMTVTAPKTANVGRPWRVVPLASEVATLLQETWELAKPSRGSKPPRFLVENRKIPAQPTQNATQHGAEINGSEVYIGTDYPTEVP